MDSLKLESLEMASATASQIGGTTAVASALVWGLTQQEWLVVTSAIGVVIGIAGFGVQLWVSHHKIKEHKAAARRHDRQTESEERLTVALRKLAAIADTEKEGT